MKIFLLYTDALSWNDSTLFNVTNMRFSKLLQKIYQIFTNIYRKISSFDLDFSYVSSRFVTLNSVMKDLVDGLSKSC